MSVLECHVCRDQVHELWTCQCCFEEICERCFDECIKCEEIVCANCLDKKGVCSECKDKEDDDE